MKTPAHSMAVQHQQGYEVYKLNNGELEIAVVPELGAKIISLKNCAPVENGCAIRRAGQNYFGITSATIFQKARWLARILSANHCAVFVAGPRIARPRRGLGHALESGF